MSNPPAATDSLFKEAFAAASQSKSQSSTSGVGEHAEKTEKKDDRLKASSDQTTIPTSSLGSFPMPVPVALPRAGSYLPDQNGNSGVAQSDQPGVPDSCGVVAKSSSLPPVSSQSTQFGVGDTPSAIGADAGHMAIVPTSGDALDQKTGSLLPVNQLAKLIRPVSTPPQATPASTESGLSIPTNGLPGSSSSGDLTSLGIKTHFAPAPVAGNDKIASLQPVERVISTPNQLPQAGRSSGTDAAAAASTNQDAVETDASASATHASAGNPVSQVLDATAALRNVPPPAITNQGPVTESIVPAQPVDQASTTAADPSSSVASLHPGSTPLNVAPALATSLSFTSTPGSLSAVAAVKANGTSAKAHTATSDIAGKRKADAPETDSDTTTSSDSFATQVVDALAQTGQGSTNHHPVSSTVDPVATQQAVEATVPVPISSSHAPLQSADSAFTTTAEAGSQGFVSTGQPAPVTPTLNSAQLIQSMHGSEMRLGMHSNEFGSISINTSLSRQVLSAQISTDHSELSRALAVHMPAIQEKLGAAYGVQAKVEVYSGGSNSQGEASQHSQSRQSESRQGRLGSLTGLTSPLSQSAALSSSSALVASSDARLDILI